MEEYRSISGVCKTEKVIERSRFITTSCHTESEEEAKLFIEKIKKQYRDATHNCSAYIADTLGNLLRFSDDGEPQGTAGMPMLEVLKNRRLVQICVVVTRYFGGIKLGAGGLVRAYSGCVAENLNEAQTVCYQPCVKEICTVDYAQIDACQRYFASHACRIEETEYGDKVSYLVTVRQKEQGTFDSELVDLLNGNLKIDLVSERYEPFPDQK